MIRKSIATDYNILSLFYREFDENGIDLFDSDPFSRIYVYEENNQIAGFISYSIVYERAEINYIYVDHNFRRKGIASDLLAYCLIDADKHGCVNVTLEVNSKNEAGIKLYEKNDFKIAATRSHYYNGVDGFLMIRELRKWKIYIY